MARARKPEKEQPAQPRQLDAHDGGGESEVLGEGPPEQGMAVEPHGPAGPGVGDVIAGDASGVGLPDALRRRAASDAPEVPNSTSRRESGPDAARD